MCVSVCVCVCMCVCVSVCMCVCECACCLYLTKHGVAGRADALAELLKWSSEDEEHHCEDCGYQDNENTEGHSPTYPSPTGKREGPRRGEREGEIAIERRQNTEVL